MNIDIDEHHPHSKVIGGLEHFYFFIIYGIILPIDKYFSSWLYKTTNQLKSVDVLTWVPLWKSVIYSQGIAQVPIRRLLVKRGEGREIPDAMENFSWFTGNIVTLWWTNSLLLKMAIEIVEKYIKNGDFP